MKSSRLTLTLITLVGLALATTATVVEAQPKVLNYCTSNPLAEVPSPSLIELDPSGALNCPQMQPSTTPSTKSLLLNRAIVVSPAAKSSSGGSAIDPKNTSVEASPPSLQNY